MAFRITTAESQGPFCKYSDVTSSASNVIIQRGVGTSTNGVAAFRASVNIIGRDPKNNLISLLKIL